MWECTQPLGGEVTRGQRAAFIPVLPRHALLFWGVQSAPRLPKQRTTKCPTPPGHVTVLEAFGGHRAEQSTSRSRSVGRDAADLYLCQVIAAWLAPLLPACLHLRTWGERHTLSHSLTHQQASRPEIGRCVAAPPYVVRLMANPRSEHTRWINATETSFSASFSAYS